MPSAMGAAAAIMLMASDAICWNPVVNALMIVDVAALVSSPAANAVQTIMESTRQSSSAILKLRLLKNSFMPFTSLSSEVMP